MAWSKDPKEHVRLAQQIVDMAEIRDDNARYKNALQIVIAATIDSEIESHVVYCQTVGMYAIHAPDDWPENQQKKEPSTSWAAATEVKAA